MSADSETLQPPNDDKVFEELCLDVWREIWGDKDAHRNARKGQAQHGVDIFGKSKGKWVAVQCKQKDERLGHRLTVRELEEEVLNALSFEPPLSTLVVATTAPAEGTVQQRARANG